MTGKISIVRRIDAPVGFLNIQAEPPAEYQQDDHPIKTYCLWEQVDESILDIANEHGYHPVKAHLEALVYPYQGKLYVFVDHWNDRMITSVARLGLFDTIEELEETLKILWPDMAE